MVFILIIPFIDTFHNFLELALINKKTYNAFYNYMAIYIEKDYVCSRRTWICIAKCECCDFKSTKPLYQIIYRVDLPPRRCIVVCGRWECRLRAFLTYLREIASNQKLLFFKPTLSSKEYFIPRTNKQTITKGKMIYFWENVCIMRKGKYYVHCKWHDGPDEWSKIVPFKEFIEYNPELKNIQFRIRDVYGPNSPAIV